MKDIYRRFLILTILILASFLIVAGIRKISGKPGLLDFLKNSAKLESKNSEVATLAKTTPISEKEIPLLQQLDEEYTKLSKAIMPSVVSINTTGVEGKQVIDSLGRTQVKASRVSGQGSGVVISYEGHIITNYHVIANKQKIEVTASDHKIYDAKLIGTDPALDIAVIKIEASQKFTFFIRSTRRLTSKFSSN